MSYFPIVFTEGFCGKAAGRTAPARAPEYLYGFDGEVYKARGRQASPADNDLLREGGQGGRQEA
jgi:hypothetical protein